MLLSFLLAAWRMPHRRNILEIPGEKFHFHSAISPATSPEYETNDHGEMEPKLPVGIIRSIKNMLWSWAGFQWLQGHLIYSGRDCCLQMISLTSNERRPLLEFISVTALLIRKWSPVLMVPSQKCSPFNQRESSECRQHMCWGIKRSAWFQREREKESFRQQQITDYQSTILTFRCI